MNEILKFNPIYKERIWGGNKISKKFNRTININNCGESWEISTVKNDISIIKDGFFRGKPFDEILKKYNKDFFGKNQYDQFPLLIKFLDSKDELSIQIHPNDDLAKKYNSLGKTEMWHILDADENSFIYVGFKDNITIDDIKEKIKKREILDIINKIPVKKGDTFFIPAGLVHGIGKNILLLEIQQSSDITYRFYDFDRVDKNGKKRDLHISEALECIDLSINEDIYKIKNTKGQLVSCKYFNVEKIHLKNNKTINYQLTDFLIIICTNGEILLNDTILKLGETALIPKSLKNLNISSSNIDSEFFKVCI